MTGCPLCAPVTSCQLPLSNGRTASLAMDAPALAPTVPPMGGGECRKSHDCGSNAMSWKPSFNVSQEQIGRRLIGDPAVDDPMRLASSAMAAACSRSCRNLATYQLMLVLTPSNDL